jgi:4-amino-4-deoxy-L-arabinose transferase-like glycosyltransferase
VTLNRRVAALILALPFLAMIAVLHGMTVPLAIFHGTDEVVYQYPTILRFSHELPFPDLHAYPAAQTPLYHLLMAYVGKVTGYALWRLRLVQVLISYLLVLATFRLLHHRLRMALPQATALALLFELSPYVFGQSFRLVTDNLALLFVVLALDCFEAFRERDSLPPFVAGCGLTAAAILTRQSTAFMVGFAALYALAPARALTPLQRTGAVAAAVLAFAPAVALFVNWHGLVPVGGDPSSCGLCVARGDGSGLSTGGLEVQTAELALAAAAFYGLVLFLPFLPEWLAGRPFAPARLVPVAAGILAGAVLLLVFPATPGVHSAGTIWRVAAKLPRIDGSSLVFWLLVPAAGALLATRIPRAPHRTLAAVLALTFIVSAVAIRYPWEKYTDPLALLLVIITAGATQLNCRRYLAGAAILAVLFVAYAADTSSHGKALPGAPGSRPAQTT